MYDVYNSINGYNLNRNRKILIVFDDIIVNIMTNKKLQAIIKEVFIRCRKLYLSLVFIIQSYFSVPKRIQIKFYALLNNEGSQQKRATTNCY